MRAVLDRAARVVERGAVHRQQRRARLLVQQPRLGPGCPPRADALSGQPDMHTAGPQRLIQPVLLEFDRLGGDFDGQMIDHHRQWLAAGAAQAADGDHFAVCGQVEFAGNLVVGRSDPVVQQLRDGILPGARQVVEQAGQLDAPMHRVLHHLRPDAALAHQQTLVDELLNGAPRGRPRQRQALRQCQLVFETVAGCQLPVLDGGLDAWAS